jgi:hypothetical protein
MLVGYNGLCVPLCCSITLLELLDMTLVGLFNEYYVKQCKLNNCISMFKSTVRNVY